MKLIIDINEEEYKEVLKDTYSGTSFENKIFTAIANGIPLDKIRAEVAEAFIKHGIGNTVICFDVLQIIDRNREDGD